MKKTRFSNRGQVLIIFVFAIIGLVGITGLAIDGSNIYSDRRHAQNAADTAVLAAALTRNNLEQPVQGANDFECISFDLVPPPSCAAQSINAALDMAQTNGYTNNIVDSTVQVFSPPVDGPYASCGTGVFDCHEYIEVKIRTNVNTYFARVLGITQLHNTVWAVALAKYDPPGHLYDGNSLVQLKLTSSSCTGDFTLGGNGIVTLDGGGIFVNSDNATCAFKETSSCVTLTLLNGAGVQGVGGTFTSSCPNAPTMTHANTQYPFPPEDLFPEPAECGQTPAGDTLDGDGYTHLYPGHYASLPPAKNTRLDPGVYCIDNFIKTTNPNSHLTGDNVFLYIKSGGAFSFQGGTVNLTAPTTLPYLGFLIYVASDYTGSPPNCSINGNAADTFTGVIYAPYCDVSINGGSSPTGYTSQIISYTLTLNGSADLYFTYNAGQMPVIPERNETGLYH